MEADFGQQAACAIEFADGVDVGDEVVVFGNWPGELDLQIALRLVDLGTIILAEACQLAM